MGDERVIFPAQVEGLLRGLSPDVVGSLKTRLKQAGLDVDAPFPPAWPASRLHEWLDLASEELYRDLPKDEAHRRIGQRFIEGWQRTMLGSAVAQFLALLGPKRALERLTRAFRTGDNYSETSCQFPSERVALVTVKSQRLPHYITGILEAGLALVKVKGTVRVEADTEAHMVFRVEWQ